MRAAGPLRGPRRSTAAPWPAKLAETAHQKSGDGASGRQAISTGMNAGSPGETIAQTAPGIPDDSSHPVNITPEEERRIAEKN